MKSFSFLVGQWMKLFNLQKNDIQLLFSIHFRSGFCLSLNKNQLFVIFSNTN